MPSRIVVEGPRAAVTATVPLRHVTDEVPGISRLRRGEGFRYVDARGRTVRDRAEMLREIDPVVARYLATTQRRRHA